MNKAKGMDINMKKQKEQWNNSYSNKDNFVFYPHEEVIRFVSKYIRKRVGLSEFKDVHSCSYSPKILDLGCGIGRHVIYAYDMRLEGYGIDLSELAVKMAQQWLQKRKVLDFAEKIKVGDVCTLPWGDNYFDYVVSHGVLDSMYFENARQAVKEVHRVMVEDGFFYCDLVSGDDSLHSREFDGEEIVATQHERGTVQSYYNYSKINSLFEGLFEKEEVVLIKRENILIGDYISRYHLVLRKK